MSAKASLGAARSYFVQRWDEDLGLWEDWAGYTVNRGPYTLPEDAADAIRHIRDQYPLNRDRSFRTVERVVTNREYGRFDPPAKHCSQDGGE